MTPLAHRFAKELTLPLRDRRIVDKAGLLQQLDKVHSFDCTAIWDSVDLALDEENMMPTILALLPETKVPCDIAWLECGKTVFTKETDGIPKDGRIAIIVEREDEWLKLSYATYAPYDDKLLFSLLLGRCRRGSSLLSGGYGIEMELNTKGDPPGRTAEFVDEQERMLGRLMAITVLLLDIINQPTLCHLRVNQPHRGIEKSLLRAGAGRYPLLAWHEVIIKPQDRPLTQQEIDGHLTGRKCLHFVRGHHRPRISKKVWVKHHWKGDPALGIKRTRYKVKR